MQANGNGAVQDSIIIPSVPYPVGDYDHLTLQSPELTVSGLGMAISVNRAVLAK
jgi:hypothetical protein